MYKQNMAEVLKADSIEYFDMVSAFIGCFAVALQYTNGMVINLD